MLNHIWLAFIVLGIGIAVTYDIGDKVTDRYANGKEIELEVQFENVIDQSNTEPQKASFVIKSSNLSKYYKIKSRPISNNGEVIFGNGINKARVKLYINKNSFEVWQKMAKASGDENELIGKLEIKKMYDDKSAICFVKFEEVSFVKIKQVTKAVIDYAKTAVNIALGLIGIMALWLGVMKVAEKAGIITFISKSVKPITKFLFPEVPGDHPAIGSIIMNISANMLGLGNAATPFGLKAMEELNSLNPRKDTATNAMCTFLAVNTAGLTLIPATAIAVRAASGSNDPTIIIGTSIFGASCATIVGILAAKIFEKFPINTAGFVELLKNNLKFLIITLAVVCFLIISIISGIANIITSVINMELLKDIIEVISVIAIPLIIILFIGFGAVRKVKVYEEFVEGAKEGFNIAVKIIPYLVAMLMAIGIFRAGGAMEILIYVISPLTDLIGFPAEALPMAMMRPLSGSGSLGIMTEMISIHGADSFLGVLVSTLFGSTETTFYVIAVYFGSVNIRKTRHALAAGLMADLAGMLGALFIVKFLFG
ncbi:MAG: nucleoside recognition domain-containing protein [Ignavibacteria bacterium]|jgi:spore maturation protein SpmA